MTHRMSSVLVIGATLLGAVTVVEGHPLPGRQGDLLDRAVAAWSKVKTARATFEQTITNPLTGRTMTATGEYQQQRPAKFSVKFDEPANDRIIADGKFVWLYLPSSTPDQVIKTPLSATGTGTLDLSAQFLTAPRTKYTVNPIGTLVVGGHPTHGYNLIPKASGTVPFQIASVWIDDVDATIRQFEVTESNGVQRRVRLLSFNTNVPVNASTFVFTPPSGVRVIEH